MKTALVAAVILAGFSAGVVSAVDEAPCWSCLAAEVRSP